MREIIKADYISDYKIKFKFSDNSEKISDLKKYLWWEVFEKLKDVNEFKKFKIDKDFWVISWINWADLAIENF